MKRTFLALCYALMGMWIAPFFAHAGEIPLSASDFRHLAPGGALSQTHVKTILQDSYGFMWFGTKNGLARYDGVNIYLLDCYDTTARRGNNNISALMEDNHQQLWAGTDAGIYIYSFREEYFRFFDAQTADGKQINDWIKDIQCDRKGNIWVVVPNQGVFRYDGERLHHYYITSYEHYVTENPECICIGRKGDVWIGTNHAGLFHYDADRDDFVQYLTDKDGNSFAGNNIYALCEYGNGLAVACHEGQVKMFDTSTKRISRITLPGVTFPVVRDVECFDGKHLWVGTSGGLFIIGDPTGEPTYKHFTEKAASNANGLSDNVIYTLYADRKGNIWLGTMFGGVSYFVQNAIPFTSYLPGNEPNSISSRKVRGLAHDRAGRIWIGTEDNGLNVLNPQSDEIHAVAPDFFHRANLKSVLTVVADGNNIICGLFKRGMVIVDSDTEHVRLVTPEELGLEDEESVSTYFRDSRGTVWVSNLRGAYRMNPSTNKLERFDKLYPRWITQIFEDKQGDIWFTLADGGVCRYTPQTDELKHYVHETDNPRSLCCNEVNGGMTDCQGQVWFSTDRGGICRYNAPTDDFTTYGKAEGLPDNATYNILEDAEHCLWLGTNRGLVRFRPQDGEVIVYTREDGLPANHFNYNSALKVGNNRFYFGTLGGLLTFDLSQLSKPKESVFPLRLTRLYINSVEQKVGMADCPLKEGLLFTHEIRLDYDQNNVSFDFAALKMGASQNIRYFYKMAPTDNTWISTPPHLTFSKLPPGTYVLYLKASDNPTSTTAETSIKLIVRPPWWRSTVAYVLYILGLAFFVTLALRYYRDRTKRHFLEKQRLFELEKEKELFRSKVEFFTEVSHEIRTPLTLINSSLEAIANAPKDEEKRKRHLAVMSQNVKRLLDLNHQLLDFRKVGIQRYNLSFTHVDVARLLRDTVERFEPSYQQCGKTLCLEPFLGECMAAIDKEAVMKVLSNLLNNGLKYAESQANVRLSTNGTTFTIVVSSDGDRIDPALSERIFTPFFRIKSERNTSFGVGIGLPMARTLAEMHSGHLYLDPDAAWNNFVLTLPLHQTNMVQLKSDEEPEVLVQDERVYDMENDATGTAPQDKNTVVLLVEDNVQVQSVVGERLREFFTVEHALNGEEALHLLKEKAVDIVVTDIMMPVMDGVELCRHIKEDETLSHLPVVFLTAKNMTEDRIDGLRVGAEAYIEKPFTFEVLKETINSILSNRRRAQDLFQKRPVMPVQNLKMNKYNEEFMEKLIACVQKNFLNEGFGVEAMADEFCMSRSALLRKIKSLTNLSAIEFIKVVRLRRAAELIKEGKYRIAEIGYMVGISTPSYFGKLFQKQFGMTPKKFEQMCKSNEPTEDIIGDLTVATEDTEKGK